MKTVVLGLVIFLMMRADSMGQATAIDGRIDYQKGQKSAAIIELPYSTEIVEGGLKQKFEGAQVKEERLKGMQVFKKARLTPTDGEVVDLYFKVQRKGRKEDNASVVYLILGRPNENVGLRTHDDNYRINDGKAFLNSLPPFLEAYQLEVNIAEQEELIKKSEKALKGLVDDEKNLETRIRELQDRLTQNKLDQETTSAELAKLRAVRDALVSKKVATK